MSLDLVPWADAPDLLAEPVAAALRVLDWSDVSVAPIDPEVADTAAFCERYAWPPEASANCVVVAGRRGELTTYVACVVLATTRTDVNGFVRRKIDARKASFAPMDEAVRRSSMEYGGITPIGLPDDWPVLVDTAVLDAGLVVVGSGLRRSKLVLPAGRLLELSSAEACAGLAGPG